MKNIEKWAESVGMTFKWEFDQDADLSWMSDEERAQEHEVLGCIALWRNGRAAASLWNIVDADRDYARQIECELASEARADMLAALMEAI